MFILFTHKIPSLLSCHFSPAGVVPRQPNQPQGAAAEGAHSTARAAPNSCHCTQHWQLYHAAGHQETGGGSTCCRCSAAPAVAQSACRMQHSLFPPLTGVSCKWHRRTAVQSGGQPQLRAHRLIPEQHECLNSHAYLPCRLWSTEISRYSNFRCIETLLQHQRTHMCKSCHVAACCCLTRCAWAPVAAYQELLPSPLCALQRNGCRSSS